MANTQPKRAPARPTGLGVGPIPVLLLALAAGSLATKAQADGPSADLDVMATLLSWSGGSQVFPLMDFVASEVQELDMLVEVASKPFAPFSADAIAVKELALFASSRRSHPIVDHVETADMARWLLQISWFEMVTSQSDEADTILQGFSALTSDRGGAECDELSTELDLAYIEAVERGLRGLESVPLERNEFEWADCFRRYLRETPICPLSISTLLLFAADVTAFAAGAVGGEHLTRVWRAVNMAQSIALRYAANRPEEVTRTLWPVWGLLASCRKQMQDGLASASLAEAALKKAAAGGRPLPAKLPLPDDKLAELGPGPEEEQVFLSIIVQCRNDNYGGEMLLRLRRMLATATHMFTALGVPTEIIVVEWNPPLGEASIAEEIEGARSKDSSKDFTPIRVIRVPTSVHMSMPHYKAHPLFEHTAENVGLRRARGKFVLKTNIDNIMSWDTAGFIARGDMREDAVYRATYAEFDFPGDDMGPGELLDWLFGQDDILRNMNLELAELSGKYPEDTHVCLNEKTRAKPPTEPRPFYWAGSGDFVLAARALLWHVRGYPEIAQNWQTDDLIHCRLRAVGATQIVLQPPCVTVHQNHRRINRVRSSTRWVVTDHNIGEVCANPFDPLPTERSAGDHDWGFPDEVFEESVV